MGDFGAWKAQQLEAAQNYEHQLEDKILELERELQDRDLIIRDLERDLDELVKEFYGAE